MFSPQFKNKNNNYNIVINYNTTEVPILWNKVPPFCNSLFCFHLTTWSFDNSRRSGSTHVISSQTLLCKFLFSVCICVCVVLRQSLTSARCPPVSGLSFRNSRHRYAPPCLTPWSLNSIIGPRPWICNWSYNRLNLKFLKIKFFPSFLLTIFQSHFLIRFFCFICGVEDSSWKYLDTPHPTRTPIYLINTSAKWSISKVALGNPQMFNLCN